MKSIVSVMAADRFERRLQVVDEELEQAVDDADLEHALQRHGILQLVRERRDALQGLRARLATLDEIEDAQLRLGFAELALDDFDHEGRAVR